MGDEVADGEEEPAEEHDSRDGGAVEQLDTRQRGELVGVDDHIVGLDVDEGQQQVLPPPAAENLHEAVVPTLTEEGSTVDEAEEEVVHEGLSWNGG